jgi:hypothetical protein
MVRRGGTVAIWWEVGEMQWTIWGRMLLSQTGMARGVFNRSRRPRSPPRVLGFDRVRRTKNLPVPHETLVWGARLGGILGAGAPKRHLGAFGGRVEML